MEKKKISGKTFLIILVLASIGILAAIGTYAYFGWSSTEVNKDATVSVTSVNGLGQCNKSSDNQKILWPVSNRNNGRIVTVSTKQTLSEYAYVTWTLTIDSINTQETETAGLKHQTFKYELVNTTTGVSYGSGNFQNLDVGDTITFSNNTENLAYDTNYTFTLYLWIDGTIGSNPMDMTDQTYQFSLVCDITGEPTNKVHEPVPTPISDFIYILGSDQTEITEVSGPFYSDFDGEIVETTIDSIPQFYIGEDDILLVRYIGSNPSVSVPATYTVDGITYNTKLLDHFCEDGFHVGVFVYNDVIEDVYINPNVSFGIDSVWMSETFRNCTSLKSVSSLPDGVAVLDYTFEGCTALITAPKIPSSVTDMISTFSGCTSLVNAPTIPSSVTDMTSTFSGCTSLVNAPVIPNSVTNMNDTFSGCTSLVNAPTIPSSVTSMSGTFSGCTSLVNAPVIPNSVTNMNGTFRGCTSLVNAPTIPSSVTSMSGTFRGCTSLVNAPVIPNSVTNMSSTFYGCTSLVNAPVIPNSVTNMSSTFYGCTSLVNVPTIPNSVTNMDSTFRNCTLLTTGPTIPSLVTNINNIFSGCANLTGTITINSPNINIDSNPAKNPFYQTSKSITVQIYDRSVTEMAFLGNDTFPSNVQIITMSNPNPDPMFDY